MADRRFGRVSSAIVAADAVNLIALEKNHRPNLAENIGSVALPIPIAWQL